MRIFKNAWFAQFCGKQRISDATLVDAVSRAERGIVDADLGGGVIKQRIARAGRGKSGGYRTIILYVEKQRAFFVYGFAKSDRENIEREELAYFKAMAKEVLKLSDMHLAELVKRGKFSEIVDDDEDL